MATRLYLRDASPTNDPGETTQSSVLPVHTDNSDFSIPVKSLSLTAGVAETSVSGSSIATENPQDNFFTSFSSPALSAQTITAQTWTIAVGTAEGNNAANSFTALSVYVFREGSGVVGYIYDSDTALGNEWPGASDGRVATFSGSQVIALADDYLVLEFWRHTAGQAMATAYTQELWYEGTTDVTEGQNDDFASYLETPQNLTFATARRIFVVT